MKYEWMNISNQTEMIGISSSMGTLAFILVRLSWIYTIHLKLMEICWDWANQAHASHWGGRIRQFEQDLTRLFL